MPATTINQLIPLLSQYVEPQGDFKNSLNQVLSRIYNMGTYRDLTVQYSLPVSDNCITLPDDASAVLHTIVNNQPVPVRALWHDFKSVGMGVGAGDLTWGLIDAGYHPLKKLIGTPTATLHIVPADQSPTKSNFSVTDGGEIRIVATDGDKSYSSTTDSVSDNDVALTFPSPISSVLNIRFEGLADAFDIRTDALDPDTTIATVGPDSGVTRYRRFRLNRSANGETVVHVLCKRAFQPIRSDDDIAYVDNIGALKHGLLGRLSDDNADIERAEYHWNKCMQLMEEEIASSRGAAIPRLNVDPYGTGSHNRIQQLY